MSVIEHIADRKRLSVATRRRTRGIPAVSLILGGLACVSTLIAVGMVFFYAPVDALQGEVFRIFYFHIPAAWIGMLAFVVQALFGIIYLIKPNERFDWIARASAEVGTVFLTIGVILGSLWAKPVWGIWWAWDAKLTAVLILWFMFLGYIMLRSYMGRTPESARAGAVWGIVGVIDVPIIYLSVQWWRGQHPGIEVSASGGLPVEALLTLLVAVVAFTLLYSFLMVQIYQLQRLQASAQRLHAIVE
jgi:heme exporter protein C